MALRATKTTFAFEAVSADNLVRRQIFEGQLVPDNYVNESGDGPPEGVVEETVAVTGLGAAPQGYKWQQGEGAPRVEAAEEAEAEEAKPRTRAAHRNG